MLYTGGSSDGLHLLVRAKQKVSTSNFASECLLVFLQRWLNKSTHETITFSRSKAVIRQI